MGMGLSHPGRAIGYALIMLGVGFIWGAIAANVPALRNARGIPHLANNGAVALPVFVAWVGLSYFLAQRYLEFSGGGPAEGLRLGVVFAAAGLLFDAIVIAGIIGKGLAHFKQPILWIAYALVLVIPWLVARD